MSASKGSAGTTARSTSSGSAATARSRKTSKTSASTSHARADALGSVDSAARSAAAVWKRAARHYRALYEAELPLRRRLIQRLREAHAALRRLRSDG